VLSSVVCGGVCIVGDSCEWSMSEVDVGCVCDVVVAVCLCLLFSRRRPVDANDAEVRAQALDVLLACASSSLTPAPARMNRPKTSSLRRPQPTTRHSLTSANRDHI
jgi:hypothetical protein